MLPLVKKLAGSSSVQSIGMALLLLLHLVLARILGASNYGEYIYVISWITIAAMFGKFGMDVMLVRLVSADVSSNLASNAKAILSWGFKWAASFTTVSMCILLSVYFLVNQNVSGTIIVGCLYLFVLTTSFCQKGALVGLGSAAMSKLPTEVLRPSLMILLVLVLWLSVDEVGSNAAMWAMLASSLVAFGVGQCIWSYSLRAKRSLGLAPSAADNFVPPRLSEIWPFVAVSVAGSFNKNVDIILLGSITGPESVAYYSVASRVANLALFVQRAATPIALPKISTAFLTDQLPALNQELSKLTLIVAGLTLSFVIVVLLFGSSILQAFGTSFVEGYPMLVILVLAHYTNVSFGFCNPYLSMTGNQSTAAKAVWIAAGLNIILNLCLIPAHGAFGAAIATGSSVIVWNILLFYHCKKLLGVNTSALSAALEMVRLVRGK